MISSGTYKVADHVFRVSASADLCGKLFCECMDNYAPFAIEKKDDCLFALNVECGEAPEYTEETRQEEEGQQIICGLTAKQESAFDFRLFGEEMGVLVCAIDYKKTVLFVLSVRKNTYLCSEF